MTEPNEFTYEIGGKTYIQRKLVLGQIRQLTELLEGVTLPGDTSDASAWVSILGTRLPRAVGIVLAEKDQPLRDKDLAGFTKTVEFDIEPEQTVQVVQDFFACNQIASLMKSLEGAIAKVTENVNMADLKMKETPETGSPSSS